jgi:hypothetical protein
MKTKSIINLLKKSDINYFTGVINPAMHFAKTNNKILSWIDQKGEALCCRVQRENDCDDIQTDYFPGHRMFALKDIKERFCNE